MKRETFSEILNGIEISNDTFESVLNDLKLDRLTEEQYATLTDELDELNGFIKTLKPQVLYELWEADSVYLKLFKKVDILPVDGIDDARVIAKHLARSWCNNEEPRKCSYDEEEFWGGDSDFGILIRRVKSEVKE